MNYFPLKFLVFIFACTSLAIAESPAPRIEPRPEWDLQLLQNSERFAVGPLGDGASTGEEEFALSRVVDRPDHDVVLTKLVQNRNIVTRLYGLCGMRALSSQQYASSRAQVLESGKGIKEVETQSGCEVFRDSLESLVERIDKECVTLTRDDKTRDGSQNPPR